MFLLVFRQTYEVINHQREHDTKRILVRHIEQHLYIITCLKFSYSHDPKASQQTPDCQPSHNVTHIFFLFSALYNDYKLQNNQIYGCA